MAQTREDVKARRLLALAVVRRMCAAGEAVSQKRVARAVQEALAASGVAGLRACEDDLKALVRTGLVRMERQGKRVRYVVDGMASAWVQAGRTGRRQRKQPPAQRRACLCCGRTFRSQGAHNRLCDNCRRGDGLPQTIYV